MKYLLTILLLFSILLGFSQNPSSDYPEGDLSRSFGKPFFLRDAQGRIITTSFGGALAIVGVADTAEVNLPQPPDTAQVFNITMVNPGDESTPPLGSGVEAYYSFEETAGVTAKDSAGSYDGDLTGHSPTLMQTGISNYCYDFDYASSEWIDFGTSFLDPDLDDLSVSLWWYEASAPGNGGLIGNWGTEPYWSIRVLGGQVAARLQIDGASYNIFSNTIGTYDTWYHLVLQIDRDDLMTLYINNVLQTTQIDISSKSAISLANSNTHAIGRLGNFLATYYHDGMIDEVRIGNVLLTPTEISNIYNQGVGKFWPYGVAGGDTLNMVLEEPDLRGDTIKVLWKHESYPTDTTDGTMEFRIPMVDVADYADTTFLHDERGDTIEYWAAFTTLEDEITDVPNKDTVFIDSSDIRPVIQDPGGDWDTLFWQDFEHHTGAPLRYTSGQNGTPGPNLFSPDFNGQTWRDSDHRWPDYFRFESGLADSISIDAETNSKVLKINYLGPPFVPNGGYKGAGPQEGEYFQFPFDGNTLTSSDISEVYYSYNVKIRAGWNPSQNGGKWASAYSGGGNDGFVGPNYDQGASYGLMWTRINASGPGVSGEPITCNFFMYYQNTTSGAYGETTHWNDFNPVGPGLNYIWWYQPDTNGDYPQPGQNMFYFDTQSEDWYNITVRIVLNTHTGSTPNYDGLVEGYINGYLIERKYGMYSHTLHPNNVNNKLRGAVAHFFGGDWGPLRDEWVIMDDICAFVYGDDVEGIPRGNVLSQPGRVLNLPNWPKE